MRNNSLAAKSMMLLLPAILLTFNISFAGWELLRNSPTTNALHSVFFLNDSTGWIAGDSSTIFKTTNSGETWIQQTSPEASNFQCITFVDATTGWACGTGGTVIKTTNSGANWFSQSFTGSKFSSMDFFDADTGYIAGDFGNIRKTTDGGSTWTPEPTGFNQNLHKIKFELDHVNGSAVGDNAIIFMTTNRGQSWEVALIPSAFGSQIFYSIGDEFYEDGKIFATGTITKYSTDQGGSWNLGEFPIEPIFSLTDLGDHRYLGVGGNGYIVRTTDEGKSWAPEQSPTTQHLYSVHCVPTSNFMWAVGASGTILKYVPNWKYSIVPGNLYEDIYFISQNTGWVVSQLGTIAKTTNSGTTWTPQNSGTSQILSSVVFTNADTGFIVGSQGTILKTTNSGTNWDALSSGTIQWLRSIYFTDINTGYVVGLGGVLLKTINGGTSWDTLSSGTSNSLLSIYFTNVNTGYVVGQNGMILKTTDAGANWGTISSDTLSLLSVYFTNADTGYTVGENGTVLKTTDGGTNWTAQTSGSADILHTVYFVDANVGYIAGGHNIYKTSNGGNNWFEDEVPGGLWGMNKMQIIVENNTAVGFAAARGTLRASFEYFGEESGGSYPGWVQVNSGTTGTLRGVEYINPSVAFVVGDPPFDFFDKEKGLILRTINGGQTWTRQKSNDTTIYLNDVSFADVNNGIAVGAKGIIFHTTNSGADWVQQVSVTSNSLDAVDMLDINNAFACGGCNIIGCGNTNTLLHTANGGITWQTQTNGTSGYWWDIDYINPTTATAVGIQGKIIRTTDGGSSWFPQTGGRNLNLSGVQFIDVNNGIAISYNGPVLRTTDGGTNWIETDSLSGTPENISYVDANNAYVVSLFEGVKGLIYRSTNGGLNWTLQDTIDAALLAVSFADANNGLVAGTNGLILRTSNSGVNSGTNSAFNRNGLNLTIGDFQNTDDSINVNITGNSSAFGVSSGYGVTRVYVKIDTVVHANDGDLEFYLEHNGIIDTLIYQNGGSGVDFLGTFLNDATNFPLASGTAPFRGSFKPYRPLSRFNGQDPNGTWRLRIYDGASGNTGTLEAWSLTLAYQSLTSLTEYREIPSTYKLEQNYPNPFNPSTTIQFELSSASYVTLTVFNILGQEVATLINEKRDAGQHSVRWAANGLSSGVYFYRIVAKANSMGQAGNYVETKKLLLLR